MQYEHNTWKLHGSINTKLSRKKKTFRFSLQGASTSYYADDQGLHFNISWEKQGRIYRKF